MSAAPFFGLIYQGKFRAGNVSSKCISPIFLKLQHPNKL